MTGGDGRLSARYLPLGIVGVAAIIMIAAVALTGRVTVPRSVAPLMAQPPLPASVSQLAALEPLRGVPAYSLDGIVSSPSRVVVKTAGQAHSTVSAPRGQTLLFGGWAYDPVVLEPARAVFLEVDGKTLIPALYGNQRPDVASYFGDQSMAATGFIAPVRAGSLAAGPHRIDVIILSADGSGYYRAIDRVVLTETTSSRRGPGKGNARVSGAKGAG